MGEKRERPPFSLVLVDSLYCGAKMCRSVVDILIVTIKRRLQCTPITPPYLALGCSSHTRETTGAVSIVVAGNDSNQSTRDNDAKSK